MRNLLLLALVGVVGSASATTLMFDDFETGSFNSNWYSPNFGSAAVVAGDGSTNYSIDTFSAVVTTALGQARQDFTVSSTGTTYAESWVYIDNYPAGQGRRYMSLLSYDGPQSTGTLQNLWAIGVNNSAASPKWFARVAFGGVGWVTLDAGPDVTAGEWHRLGIEIDDTNATFWVDGVMAGQFGRGSAGAPNVVRIGDGLSSASNMWYDNVGVYDAVPEPASMLALGAGLAALAARRRRKA